MEEEKLPTARDIAVQLVLSGILVSLVPTQRSLAISMTQKLLNDFVEPSAGESEGFRELANQVEIIVYRLLDGLPIHDTEPH